MAAATGMRPHSGRIRPSIAPCARAAPLLTPQAVQPTLLDFDGFRRCKARVRRSLHAAFDEAAEKAGGSPEPSEPPTAADIGSGGAVESLNAKVGGLGH